ncbi:phage replisome organizer N-terminal domain-containing protein [uncultured Acidaminococcus sp.]|uniref:phage replisome organizer N-terminal domain-containing protein n=1 Tax=uncultured Acidaminococcus sp. TaxID=352152 RepID=UPI00259336A8|nr:phage replisome organizer N-terminal domain-containing protein [uncultured Acidaminococcus sp.]
MGRPWIKLSTAMFDDEKIKLIKDMPEGKDILLIWIQLLCFAGKTDNDGVFMLTNKIPYNEEMLASIFQEKVSTVRLALRTFLNLEMMEKIEGAYALPNWTKYQADVDAISRAKQRNKERQQRWRDKQKQPLLEASSSKRNVTETLRNENDKNNHFSQRESENVTLRRRYVTLAEKEEEKELEKELDKEESTKDKQLLKAAASAFNNQYSVNKEVLTREGETTLPNGVKTVEFYDKNVFPLTSSYERERLLDLADEYGDDWCIAACKEAIDHQARSIAYIDKVLRTWRAKGFKSVSGKQETKRDTQYDDIPF